MTVSTKFLYFWALNFWMELKIVSSPLILSCSWLYMKFVYLIQSLLIIQDVLFINQVWSLLNSKFIKVAVVLYGFISNLRSGNQTSTCVEKWSTFQTNRLLRQLHKVAQSRISYKLKLENMTEPCCTSTIEVLRWNLCAPGCLWSWVCIQIVSSVRFLG